jgi:beta-galactosidase
VLGLEIHEFLPLRHEETITLSTGSTGTVWAEEITPRSATVISHYLDGPAASRPAITSNSFGSGTAWYVSTKVDGGDLTAVLLDAVETAGIEIPPRPPAGLEVASRSTETDNFTFLINHSEVDAEYPVHGRDLIAGKPVDGTALIPAGSLRVFQSNKALQ